MQNQNGKGITDQEQGDIQYSYRMQPQSILHFWFTELTPKQH